MGEAAQSRYSDGTAVGCEYHFFVLLLIEVKILATQLGPSLVVGPWRRNKFSRLRCIGIWSPFILANPTRDDWSVSQRVSGHVDPRISFPTLASFRRHGHFGGLASQL